MTKEELKKEAEKKGGAYVDKLETMYGDMDDTSYTGYQVIKAYEQGALDFAEPREKRIAELEAQIEKMKQCGNCGNGTIGNCEHCKRKPKQKSTDTDDYWRLKEIK